MLTLLLWIVGVVIGLVVVLPILSVFLTHLDFHLTKWLH